jgi:two-component system LytT family response regulator
MTAIIVDDEKHCREVLEHLLTRHCPDVQVTASCKDGAEALKVLDHQSPDLLFLDIEMPGMNGFEVLEQSTRHDFDIIFTTGV